MVGYDVGAAAAGDGADVEGRVSEDGVGVGGESIGELAIEEVEGGGELEDGVFAEVWLGGVGGFAGGLDGGPEGAFGGVDEVEGGGLADESELVVRGVVFGEVLGAGLVRFFAHETDEVDGDGEVGETVFVFEKSDEHGGHGAFGIRGAAAPDFSIADFGGEGVDGHSVHGDGVEVRA